MGRSDQSGKREAALPACRRRPGRHAIALLLGLSAALAPGTTSAEEAEVHNPHLEQALRDIEAGRIDAAEQALDEAMAWPRNDHRTLVEIYRNLAIVHLYTGKEDEAYEDLARLLNLDLHYELPSPAARPLRELFERVRRAYADGLLRPIRVAHDPPLVALPNAPVTVAATISNLKEGFGAVLLYRRQGETEFHEVPMTRRPGNRFSATVPGQALPEGQHELMVEYYLEIRDRRGRRVQGRGSAPAPLTFLIEAPGPAPGTRDTWTRSPWLWATVGVLAAGALAGGVIAATSNRRGTLPLTIHLDP